MVHRVKLFGSACALMFALFAIRANAAPATQPDRTAELLRILKNPANKTVLVVAHRGGWGYGPENSLKGIRKCIDMGVDALEIDVQKTSDGQFVLMHDKTLDRTTTGNGPVSSFTLAELRDLRLKDTHGRVTDERIPTLGEVMELSRGHVLVYLDKTEERIDEVYAYLKTINATDFAIFYGYRRPEQLRARYGDLVDKITYLPKLDDKTVDLDGYIRGFGTERIPAFVIEFKTDNSPVIQEIGAMKEAGARVWASPLLPWMVAGRTDKIALKHPDQCWGWMIKRGVNIFCTDQPQELLDYLRANGLHG